MQSHPMDRKRRPLADPKPGSVGRADGGCIRRAVLWRRHPSVEERVDGRSKRDRVLLSNGRRIRSRAWRPAPCGAEDGGVDFDARILPTGHELSPDDAEIDRDWMAR